MAIRTYHRSSKTHLAPASPAEQGISGGQTRSRKYSQCQFVANRMLLEWIGWYWMPSRGSLAEYW